MLSLLLAGWLSVGWFSDFFDNPIQTVADTITNNIETVAVVAAAVATDGFSLGATEGAALAEGATYGGATIAEQTALNSAISASGAFYGGATVAEADAINSAIMFSGGDAFYGGATVAEQTAINSALAAQNGFSWFNLKDAANLVKTGNDLVRLVNGTTIAQAATPPARPPQLGMTYYPPAISSNPSFGIARGWQAAAPPPAAAPQWYETTAGQLLAGAAVAGGLVLFAKKARG